VEVESKIHVCVLTELLDRSIDTRLHTYACNNVNDLVISWRVRVGVSSFDLINLLRLVVAHCTLYGVEDMYYTALVVSWYGEAAGRSPDQ
jgi:hypothetical protein